MPGPRRPLARPHGRASSAGPAWSWGASPASATTSCSPATLRSTSASTWPAGCASCWPTSTPSTGPGPGWEPSWRTPGHPPALAALDGWEAILRRDQLEAYPELDLAAGWLRAHAPTSPRTVLVHGDFKPGNVLLVDGAIVALLDWELAHLGDPHEDLGWVTQPLRTREHFIPGAWERDELLGCYEELSGRPVDHDAVAWWNVLASYKTAVMQVSGLRAFVEGRSDELYQPSAAVLDQLLRVVG